MFPIPLVVVVSLDSLIIEISKDHEEYSSVPISLVTESRPFSSLAICVIITSGRSFILTTLFTDILSLIFGLGYFFCGSTHDN